MRRLLAGLVIIGVIAVALPETGYSSKWTEALRKAKEKQQRKAAEKAAQEAAKKAAAAPAAAATAPAQPVEAPIRQTLDELEARYQVKQAVPVTTRKVAGLVIEVSYPCLMDGKFLASAFHLIGAEPAVPGLDMAQLVRVNIRNTTKTDVEGLRVRAELLRFSDPAIESVSVPAGSSVTVNLTPTFGDEFPKLLKTKAASLYFGLASDTGKTLYEETKRVSILGRNETLAQVLPLWAVFVDPEDRMVGELLDLAGDAFPGGSLSGYQADSKGVYDQVGAVYDALNELGLRYGNGSTTGVLSGARLVTQRVRFPSESFEKRGMDCIDGSILMASALEKIGLDVRMVFVPGGAFVGVPLQKGGNTWIFVELGVLGASSFDGAVETGWKEYTGARDRKAVRSLDLAAARAMNVKPFQVEAGRRRTSVMALYEANATRNYAITLKQAGIHQVDYEAVGFKGMGPALVVQGLLNGATVFNTTGEQRWILDNNPMRLGFVNQPHVYKVALKRGDDMKFGVLQEVPGGDGKLYPRMVLQWTLTWKNFISRRITMKSAAGSFVDISVTEVR